MSDIVACYAVFNEAEHIADSIRSVKAYVDRFVIVDSAFITNPVEACRSTDETRSIIERVCAASPSRPVEYLPGIRKLPEHAARNRYLSAVMAPDWCLVVDGDEVLYGDWQAINAMLELLRRDEVVGDAVDLPVYTVALNADKQGIDVTPDEWENNPLISTMGLMPRLFRASPSLRYESAGQGFNTPVLTYRQEGRRPYQLKADRTVPPWSMFLVNHHTRQSLEGYKADYVWAMSA